MKLEKIASSVDPTKVSLTVRGVLVSVLPLAMAFYGIPEAEIMPIIDLIVDGVFYVLTFASLVMTLWGVIRKFINKN